PPRRKCDGGETDLRDLHRKREIRRREDLRRPGEPHLGRAGLPAQRTRNRRVTSRCGSDRSRTSSPCTPAPDGAGSPFTNPSSTPPTGRNDDDSTQRLGALTLADDAAQGPG